jgi:trans-2-enoyl-CoA reductase
MYYFDTLGIAFVNSAEEGREGDPSSVSKFNQFTGIDMTLSNSIQGYFSMLSKIEEAVENITEAISLYIYSLKEDQQPIPKEDLIFKSVQIAS